MAATSTKPQHKRLLRKPAVRQKVGYSDATIYRLVAKGEFPAPIKIGDRASAWIEEEIDAWIDARIEASRQGGAQ